MVKKILVEGMSCMHCVKHVTDALNEVNGVSNVNVSLDTKTATIEANDNVKDQDIKAAIEDAGYEVVNIQ
ncbi:MAG: copper ion binding protein [Clostridiaceae bacterium]|jgi:copper ion binding protein|nr:copper ion binding protein [Clostridiaceae bacterium]